MDVITIDFRNEKYDFNIGMSYKEFSDLIESYPKEINRDKAQFWTKKNDFCVWLLQHLCMYREFKDELTEVDWPEFFDVFHEYFFLEQELAEIQKNSEYLLGLSKEIIPNYYFNKYMLLCRFGNMSPDDVDDLRYKEAITYSIYLIRAFNANFPIVEKKQNEPEGIS